MIRADCSTLPYSNAACGELSTPVEPRVCVSQFVREVTECMFRDTLPSLIRVECASLCAPIRSVLW